MKVYAVQAYRFSDFERHSYICGIYSTFDAARKAAITEEEFRGGKYGCTVQSFELDKNDMQQDIELWRTDFFEEENKKLFTQMIEDSQKAVGATEKNHFFKE